MYRRRILAATAGAVGSIAGCTRSTPRLIDRIENDPVPAALPAEVRATLVREVSREHPPRIGVSFTATERVTVAFDGVVPFGDHFGDGPGDAVLVLSLPEADRSLRNGCWRSDPISSSPAIGQVDLGAGETLTVEYDLLSSARTGECWPSGSYRFEQAYPVLDGPTVTWGFAVVVE